MCFSQPDTFPAADLHRSVIAARCRDQWLLCRQKFSTGWILPGAKLFEGESAEQAARRALWEMTGAMRFNLLPVSAYRVSTDPDFSGILYRANVFLRGSPPSHANIDAVYCEKNLPPGMIFPAHELLEKAASFTP